MAMELYLDNGFVRLIFNRRVDAPGKEQGMTVETVADFLAGL
jgi:hypothetical protein